jgi:hypothetical protein
MPLALSLSGRASRTACLLSQRTLSFTLNHFFIFKISTGVSFIKGIIFCQVFLFYLFAFFVNRRSNNKYFRHIFWFSSSEPSSFIMARIYFVK